MRETTAQNKGAEARRKMLHMVNEQTTEQLFRMAESLNVDNRPEAGLVFEYVLNELEVRIHPKLFVLFCDKLQGAA